MNRKKRIKREEKVKKSTLLFPTNLEKKPHNPRNKLVIPRKTKHTFAKKGLKFYFLREDTAFFISAFS